MARVVLVLLIAVGLWVALGWWSYGWTTHTLAWAAFLGAAVGGTVASNR